jgi:putative Ca2+/H+ antiporter (TMEM165/GDT1 family)
MRNRPIALIVGAAVALVFTSGLSASTGELDPTFAPRARW